MADHLEKDSKEWSPGAHPEELAHTDDIPVARPRTRVSVVDLEKDDTALPAGTFDPVYEAKARVLNRAVSRGPFGCGAQRAQRRSHDCDPACGVHAPDGTIRDPQRG